ncbi:MAG: VOC family protein [Ruminococcus sp.]|nr:VOC family protein [Ruminococcus sp.]
MKIEHIAMYVANLERAKDFFMKYFGAVSNQKYQNLKTGFSSYFLSFNDGARLEIMNKSSVSDGSPKFEKTGFVHIAFSVGTKEKVNELTKKLQADGYKVISNPRITGD